MKCRQLYHPTLSYVKRLEAMRPAYSGAMTSNSYDIRRQCSGKGGLGNPDTYCYISIGFLLFNRDTRGRGVIKIPLNALDWWPLYKWENCTKLSVRFVWRGRGERGVQVCHMLSWFTIYKFRHYSILYNWKTLVLKVRFKHLLQDLIHFCQFKSNYWFLTWNSFR